jgi:hypothetical protein
VFVSQQIEELVDRGLLARVAVFHLSDRGTPACASR